MHSPDNNLLSGKDGRSGESGGNIYVKFLQQTNYEKLTLCNDGGKGGNGQDGGDGLDGQDGKDAPPKWTEKKLIEKFPSTATWKKSRHDQNLYKVKQSMKGDCRESCLADSGIETGTTLMDEVITVLSRTKKTFGIERRHFFVHVCGKFNKSHIGLYICVLCFSFF